MENTKWLHYVKRIQAIAQAGLTYGENKYDIDRYQDLRNLSMEMMKEYTGEEIEPIRNLFASEKGYQTPKIDIRGVVFNHEGKILMVREMIDNRWSLPGGWADVGYSPRQIAVKEVWEESGFEVETQRLLAVFDKNSHPHPPDIYQAYKLFILCKITGGEAKKGMETSDVAFFDRNNLPELSTPRNTEGQILMMFEYLDNPEKPVYFD